MILVAIEPLNEQLGTSEVEPMTILETTSGFYEEAVVSSRSARRTSFLLEGSLHVSGDTAGCQAFRHNSRVQAHGLHALNGCHVR